MFEYRSSAAAYEECLASHPPAACESQRLTMETDMRQMQTIGGTTVNNNVNVNR